MNNCYCSICCNTSNNNDFIKLSCGHMFHNKCIIKWFDFSNNESCPYCRMVVTEPILFSFSECLISKYRYRFRYSRRSVIINDIQVSFINRILLNENYVPYSWCSLTENYSKYIFPIYKLPINDSSILISLYTRLYILYGDIDNITLNPIDTINKIIYYDIDKPIIGNLDKKAFDICFEWIYDIMFELKNRYEFTYNSVFNTFICDLFIVTLKHFRIEKQKNLYQAVITSSIFNTLKYFKNLPIKLEDVNYYTDGAYSCVKIEVYNTFQNIYIKENIY